MLRDRIRDGTIPGGYRLVEEDLAEQFGVSRTPVRAAIQQLVAEGFVESQLRGYRVAEVTMNDIEDALGIRRLLEQYAARRAVTRITEEQLEELRRICQKEERILEREEPEALRELTKLNERFHRNVTEAAGSEILGNVLDFLRTRPVYSFYAFGSAENVRRFADSHCRLVQALADGDAEKADSEIDYHIDLAQEILTRREEDTSGSVLTTAPVLDGRETQRVGTDG
jgi:DNA-binding GntR family transcriptional regulator